MSFSSVVKVRRVAVAAIAGAAAAVTLFAGTATAASPFLVVDGFDAQSSAAFDLYAAGGLLNIAPTPLAFCDSDNPESHRKLASLSLGVVGSAKVLTSDCTVDGNGATSSSAIASVSLLGGKIKATAITSTCTDEIDGNAVVGSRLTTLNGKPAPGGRATITIPHVATVYLDKLVDDGSTVYTIPIEVVVAPVLVLGHVVTAGQVIDVGGCGITRYPPID